MTKGVATGGRTCSTNTNDQGCIICGRCSKAGHCINDCTQKRDSAKCTHCKREGHVDRLPASCGKPNAIVCSRLRKDDK